MNKPVEEYLLNISRRLFFGKMAQGIGAMALGSMLALAPANAAGSDDIATLLFGKASPGPANGTQKDGTFTLSNNNLKATWAVVGNKLQPVDFTELANGTVHSFAGRNLFRVGLAGVPGLPATSGFVPVNLASGDFTLVAPPTLQPIPANPTAVKAADREAGWRISADFKQESSGLNAHWSAELRDGSHYLRQTLKLSGEKGKLTGIQGLETPFAGAKNSGTAIAGNPATTPSLFMGLEQPMAKNDFSNGMAAGLACDLPLSKDAQYEVSSVIGTYPSGQLRRAFLRYLERERPAPYRPFLHYNGWFDFAHNVSEPRMIESIQAYKKNLIDQHGVPVAAFVIDDGWDDWDKGFWEIDRKKFPNDFNAVRDELDRANSRFGIWISPLGGYGKVSDKRIELAAKNGMIAPGSKDLDLSYPPYFKWFLDKNTRLITEDKVAYFKFDKAGNGVNPHFLALLRICHELRKVDPNLVINITVGTWPSPFWLNHIDCTWREGADMDYEGPGDERERWITYRDAQTWRGVVNKAPLYPLNSIMTHGICLSDGHDYPRKALESGANMRNEARTYFGSGTLLQELYVRPANTPPEAWKQIAEAAKWSQAHADVLVDTHWIGGNPSLGKEVYGWAAWSPRKGVITLRNPSDKEVDYALDIQKAFELPDAAAKSYEVKGAYPDAPAPIEKATAGEPVTLKLKPFEVLVMEFSPK
jgi:hypothetical protein